MDFDLQVEEPSGICIPIQTINQQGEYVKIHAMGILNNKVVGLKVVLKKDFILTPFYTEELEPGRGAEIIVPHNQGDVLGSSQKYSCHMPRSQNGVVFSVESEEGNAFVNALADWFCYTKSKHNNQTLYNLCFDALQLEQFSLPDQSLEHFDYNIAEKKSLFDFNSPGTIREIIPFNTENSEANLIYLKLFCTQKQGYYSEIYLNIDLDNKFLIFMEKDSEYRENLMHSFFQPPSF